MRIEVVTACLLLAGCAAPSAAAHWAALPVLGPLQAGLLYQREGLVPPDERLAFALGDVCGERDETARRDAVVAARPRLERAFWEASTRPAWTIPLRQVMGSYDPQHGGFTIGLHTGSVVRFDRSDFCRQDLTYLVAFENGDAYGFLRLPEADAVRFVRANPARAVVHDLEVEVTGAQPGPPAPTLLVRITRRRTRDAASGRVLADTGLSEPEADR
jgi:hypothetical protein